MIGRTVIEYYDDPTDVITLAEVKAHLDVIRTDQDTLIETYLGAAIDWASNWIGFSIRRASVHYFFDQSDAQIYNTSPDNLRTRYGLRIPANVLTLNAIYYRNESLTATALSASDYDFSQHGGHIPLIKIINTPSTFADTGWSYRVEVVEGFYNIGQGSTANDSDLLPSEIKLGILMKCRDLYDFRGDENLTNLSKLHTTAEMYLNSYMKRMIV